jgi:HK97 family phage portal protein
VNSIYKIKNFFSRKESAVQNIIVSPGTGGVIWTPEDYRNFAKETYMKNIISFRCIDIIARSCSTVPWSMIKYLEDGKTEEIPNHPINNLLKRPNPRDSFAFLIIQMISYILISGNNYVERVSPITGPNKDIPKELYVHRPDRFTVLVNENTGAIRGYRYRVEGSTTREYVFEVDETTGRSNILHMRTFNPLNDFYGMAVTQPVAREIDTSNEAVTWNKKLLENVI